MVRGIETIFGLSITRIISSLFAITITLFLSDQSQAQEGRAAWERSYVYVDGNSKRGAPTQDIFNNRKPILLYFHGCAGLSRESAKWGEMISELGFIVITPDSFAEADRQKSCILGERKSKEVNKINKNLRHAEIKYALDAAASYDLKKHQVFVMGHSEGANAVSTYPFSNISGLILSGYTCWRGISAKPSIPVLAIQWEHDPNFTGNHREDLCSNHFKGRSKLSQQVMLSGSGHDTSYSSTAKESVSAFLLSLTKR